MKRRPHMSRVTGVLVLVFLMGGVDRAGAVVKKCTICHGKPAFKKVLTNGQVVSLYVDEELLAESVHREKKCVDCHADVEEIPHREPPQKVDCTRCHYRGNVAGAPQQVDYEAYRRSVHGRLSMRRRRQGTFLPGLSWESSGASPRRHPRTDRSGERSCDLRHLPSGDLRRVHRERARPRRSRRARRSRRRSAPTVTASTRFSGTRIQSRVCLRLTWRRPVRAVTEPYRSCSKYGIEVEQVATYEESFHGIASKFGSRTVASCASCHGVHDIRGPDDPRSSVHFKNIPGTCGKCHEGANVNYAKGKIHVDATKKSAGVIYWVALFFKWLTISTMVGLVLHIGLDLNRKSREWRAAKAGVRRKRTDRKE